MLKTGEENRQKHEEHKLEMQRLAEDNEETMVLSDDDAVFGALESETLSENSDSDLKTRHEINEKTAALEAEIARMRAKLAQDEGLSDIMAMLTEEIESLKKQLLESNAKNESFQITVGDQNVKIDDLNAQLLKLSLNTTDLNAEMANLLNVLNDLRTEKDNLCYNLQDEIDALKKLNDQG